MGRIRTVLRWPAVFATLGSVLVVAGSAPAVAQPSAPAVAQPDDDAALYAQCLKWAQEKAETYPDIADGPIVTDDMACVRRDGTPVDPKLWLPARPSRPAPTGR